MYLLYLSFQCKCTYTVCSSYLSIPLWSHYWVLLRKHVARNSSEKGTSSAGSVKFENAGRKTEGGGLQSAGFLDMHPILLLIY